MNNLEGFKTLSRGEQRNVFGGSGAACAAAPNNCPDKSCACTVGVCTGGTDTAKCECEDGTTIDITCDAG
jgi:hypothetical protein